MERALRRINFTGNYDVAFALGILAILTVLFAPLPPFILDIGLSFSLALSVLILMVALWIEKPLNFSSFPTVLLVATILRLALNIASTRLILSNGHQGADAAGGVIYGFSHLMIGGNYVIGLIVFAILIIINFLVITKGATRIAEVGARFTLDAIPGKQMAIDADLAAGLIDDNEARSRRRELEDESAFFGSMDGASKFVRGDAIAGMIITFINIIGGMIVGMAQEGIALADAAASYTTLTVGDGLASQIPALVVSLAAGLLVSKGRNYGSTDKAVFAQLGEYPKALYMVAGLMALLAVTPGLPPVPFLLFGGMLGAAAYYFPKLRAEREKETAYEADVEKVKEERAEDILPIEDLKIEVGSQLLSLIADPNKGLPAKVKSLRRRFATDYGFLMPPVRIKDDIYVAADAYRINIHETECATGTIRMNAVMAIANEGETVDIPGDDTIDPSFGMPARWIDPSLADEAEAAGYTVVDGDSVLITHLAETVKTHLPQLFNYAALQRLIDTLDPDYRKLLSDLVPAHLSMIALQRVLQGLLAEQISIRNLPLILEAVTEASSWTRNPTAITEHVRSRLAKEISSLFVGDDGYMPVIMLSPQWEEHFLQSLTGKPGEDRTFAMPPSVVQEFISAARSAMAKFRSAHEHPVILSSAEARPFVRSLLERTLPDAPILSHNELHTSVSIKTIGQI